MVVGNTEVGQSASHLFVGFRWFGYSAARCVSGIEVKFKNMMYPVILAPAFVPELMAVTHTEDGEFLLMRADDCLSRCEHNLPAQVSCLEQPALSATWGPY